MRSIPVYDTKGSIADTIQFPENIEYISGRTSVGDSGIYYKGAGATYVGHCVLDKNCGLSVIQPSDVFYYGWVVENPVWVGKFGVFNAPLQPYFSDLVGACGPKEESIIKKSTGCPVSNVDVVGYTDIPAVAQQR